MKEADNCCFDESGDIKEDRASCVDDVRGESGGSTLGGWPVFAFFKPRPMITDLTKGGMGDVAREMGRLCSGPRPWPVGQLDRNTTGLMLFTRCGRLTEHLNNHVSKTYRVSYLGCSGSSIAMKGELTDDEVRSLLHGCFLQREQVHVRFTSVERRGSEQLPCVKLPSGEVIQKFRYQADVSIERGLFHVVKRLFGHCVARSVSELQRLSVAGLTLDAAGLREPGDIRKVTQEGLAALWGGCPCRLCPELPSPVVRASAVSDGCPVAVADVAAVIAVDPGDAIADSEKA
eukprot:TRINITY_DN54674_c0_g1_i1.p1 TRINITY_DN54674_c0_g1~~TRINITY_DN54674_c0_g1_i1.p1  ORF type:complete len:289 (+),score=46.99 TRINITY_DN54674_c0_g1_i1:328-1194(+)